MAVTTLRSTDRILNKALELFSTKGYDGSSVREICEAAGITKPTLYHFYGSKEGVYRALVDGALEDFRRDLRADLEAAGTAEERLKRVARGYFRSARSQPELTRFLFSLVHNPPSSAPKTDFHSFYEQIVSAVAAEVDAGVARGEFAAGPTHVRMLVFMGALAEAVCGSLILGRPELTRELADELAEAILKGWR